MNGVVIVLCFWTLFTVPLSSSQNVTNNGLPTVLSAVTKLLEYVKKNYQGMTLDTVFGLRVIEGQCKLLADEHEKEQLEFVSKNVIKVISDLGIDAGKLANMALPHTLEQDREYFGMMKQLTVAPWKVFQSHRVVNPSLRWNFPLNPPDFTEIDADMCMSELMSGAKKSQNPCKLTEDCLHTMLAPGQLGHLLQRQIFYTIVAKKMGCESQVNDYLAARSNYKNLDQVQHLFCTNAYYELEEASATHGLTDDYRDLFLETEFVCPSIGYFQFMRSEWLDAIISWQSDEGCFPKKPGNSVVSTPARRTAKINNSYPIPRSGAIQLEHPNIPPPPNFLPQGAQLHHPQEHSLNDTADLADDEAPQYVTLASPNMAKNALVSHQNALAGHHPSVSQFRPVYALPAVPQNRNDFQASLHPQLQQPHQQPQPHYDVPFAAHSPIENQRYGNIHGYQDQEVQVETYQQAEHNRLPEAQQVPQPLYVWNNDVAYAPYASHHVDPHNLPRVVPHHMLQHEAGPQGMQPQRYASPDRYAPQQHPQQQSGVGVNPYLREYRIDRGLKSVDDMTKPQQLMREKVIADGCLSHLTSMASAALSIYMRYLVDPGPPEFMHLRLENHMRHNAALKAATAPQVEVSNAGTHLRVKVSPGSTGSNGLPPQPGVLKEPPVYPPMAIEQDPEPNVHPHHSSLGSGPGGEASRTKLDDMMSHAWNFMGTYKKYYGGKFHQPIHAGSSASEGVGMVPDYVHKAEVDKVLPDWTVALESRKRATAAPKPKAGASGGAALNGLAAVKDNGLLSTAAAWVRHKDVNQRKGFLMQGKKKAVWQQVASPEEFNVKERQMEVHIVEIQSPFQRDLDHYFVVITVISVICLFVLFRYFRQRRNVVRSKTRNF